MFNYKWDKYYLKECVIVEEVEETEDYINEWVDIVGYGFHKGNPRISCFSISFSIFSTVF